MKNINKVDLKLARKMAKSVAEQINYVGLDAPSNAAWSGMEDIVSSFHLDEKVEKDLRKKIDAMPYKDVMKLEEKVNQLLETGKYD